MVCARLLAIILLALCSSLVNAQQQGEEPATPASVPESAAGGLQEIIVTAQRRTEDAQKSALAITALNGNALAAEGVTNTQGLSSLVPALSVATAGIYTQIFLRGVGDFNGTPISNTAIAVNLDQVYQGSAALVSGFFYDLERVELLKGPQGTLYGRNASGGAMNLITRKPVLDSRDGFLTLGGGNYGGIQSEGALNLPVGETLAVRAAFQTLKHDGYYQDGYDDEDRQGGRIQALYQPSDNLSLLLGSDYGYQGGKGGGNSIRPTPVPGDPWIGPSDPRSIAAQQAASLVGPILRPLGNDGFFRAKTYGVNADLEWKLGSATLSVIPAYRRWDVNAVTYAPGFYNFFHTPQHQTSLETRIGSNGEGPLQYVLGLFYYDLEQKGGSFGTDVGPTVTQGYDEFRSYSNKSAAAFSQATYSVTDTLRLTAGLRYTWDRKVFDVDQPSVPTFNRASLSNPALPRFLPCLPGQTTIGLPPPSIGIRTFPGLSYFCNQFAGGELTAREVNWKAGIEYDLAARSLLYFTAGTGFKAGGFYNGSPPNTYDPEKLLAFEFGSKNRLVDNRLQLNLEAFFWKYSDQQVSRAGPVNPPGFIALITENAGKSTLYGLSTDVQYALSSHDLFGLAFEYLHTKYDDFQYRALSQTLVNNRCQLTPILPQLPPPSFNFTSVDCSGKPLIRSPEWSGTARYQHTFDLTGGGAIVFGARTQFSSGYFLTPGFVPGEGSQKSFTYSSADLTYQGRDDKWSLTAYVQNIEDEAVAAGGIEGAFNPAVFYVIQKPPRTYGARATFRF